MATPSLSTTIALSGSLYNQEALAVSGTGADAGKTLTVANPAATLSSVTGLHEHERENVGLQAYKHMA